MNAGVTGLVTVTVTKATKCVPFEDFYFFKHMINIWAEFMLQVVQAASGLIQLSMEKFSQKDLAGFKKHVVGEQF